MMNTYLYSYMLAKMKLASVGWFLHSRYAWSKIKHMLTLNICGNTTFVLVSTYTIDDFSFVNYVSFCF